MSRHSIADQPGKGERTMSFHSWLQNLRSSLPPRRSQGHDGRRGSLRASTHRPSLEVLEDRVTPSFGWVGSFPIVDNAPAAMVTADFNNDGHLDLATSGGDLLLGDGDGGFVAGSSFAAGGLPAVADFNNDGNLDLAMVDGGSQVASVQLGNGDGTFGPPVRTAILPGPTDVAAADFNADGNMDLVYSANDDQLLPSSVEVLLGDGQGGFAARHQYDIRTASARGLAVGDLNADGRPDVVTANYDITADHHQEGTVSVLLGNGDGTLSYDFDSSNLVVGAYTRDVAVGDFTSDGIPDLITNRSSSVTVLPGRGDGTFAAPILTNCLDPLWLPATDFNGDGRLDY